MDPLSTALVAIATVRKTVDVIKQAKSAVSDVASLGPMLGNYFGAKQKAIQAVEKAKAKGGSSLGQAIKLEMELLGQKQFEDELKMLFMTTGHIDVWNNIMARVAEATKAEKAAAQRKALQDLARQKKLKQAIETGIALALVFLVGLPVIIWSVVKLAISLRDMKAF
jgi:lysophospholipase L1-like esterase